MGFNDKSDKRHQREHGDNNIELSLESVIFILAFSSDLEKDVVRETSGHFRRLLVSVSDTVQSVVFDVDTFVVVREHAMSHLRLTTRRPRKKHKSCTMHAGEKIKSPGTVEFKFNILASRSFPQLKAAFDEYVKVCHDSSLVFDVL